ncbi:Ig-like domain-containing protein [Tengunoibacter tsumagoiensis]|uniref:BIG2 domain-containing protein n=1 Tax=Tengunoibacter tsumagoiensis TaxID=2014871 RepID=A0A401ZWA3_9CHLR|nr:Ig-like domain-containing protein [Tengunoibacter tsumagoiensis]GCE11163.1 hypothetical protein KTT_10220 [Tengunoibacter tsumagoiensis]
MVILFTDYAYAYFHLGDKAGDNAQSHGMDWIPYYLQQMQAYQQSHGTRLLDYLDVHAYGAQSNSNDDPSSNASRLDSTRALWDPTYNGSTAIGQYFNPPQQIGLIPALKAWTNKYYPGTKTSISEYSYGDETNNGALTQADVLGIYGREGLDMAEYWGNINPTDPIASAFRAYLNFDGHGAQYGDTSVHGTSADQGKLSIYSAQRSRDNALTLQVINKTGGDLTSTLALSHFAADSTAHVYSYSSSNLAGIVQQPDLAMIASGFTATYPANSITTIVIPQQGSPYVGGAAANAAPSTLNTLQADASSYALFAGQTYQTVATTIDSNGVGTIVTNSVAYTSDNTAVATVNSSGLVTATGAGTVHITGSYQGKSFTVTVTGVALQSIKLDAAYTLPQGAQHQTIVTAVNSDGSTVPVPITSATYTSSNSSIATISSTGVVTALAAGTVKITAVYQGHSNSTTVTVPKSQPLPSSWLHLDIGAVAASGTVSYNSGTFNVSGSGADVWQAQDQEQFVYQPLSSNGTIIARMTSTSPVNTYAKGGLMLRDGLTAGSNLVYLAMFPTGGVQLGAGSGANASIQGYWSQDAGTATFPYWLRLDRNNDVVTASVSTDGTTWTQSPQQIAFPTGQAYVGLFSTDHGAPLLNTSIFDHVTVKKGSSAVPLPTGALPSGWKAVDLGPVGGPGHVGYQNKTFTLLATGQNIIGGSDSGYFVYHTLSGDGSITARVATQANASNPYAEAGVMLRDGLQYGANVAFLGISPGAYTRMNVGSATATNGIANVWQCGCAYTAPYWLRIVRAGTTLTAFTSPDGLTWTQQTQQTFVAGPILIGLAEDAASNVVFNPATFDNVTLTATIFGARPQH